MEKKYKIIFDYLSKCNGCNNFFCGRRIDIGGIVGPRRVMWGFSVLPRVLNKNLILYIILILDI